ncbi:MAG: hypothetical protein L0332_15680 [Chloroflexi bacterium]|nr:hypothetical protein [Chloroflexota bacterium]MCI0577063.1 hypothetical protein [Chloroflexota bacterium]MCI0643533.1 hypothetical protein [Chloroflexota bacterium]MCI0728143.1 hypothetical protein [Chloroflexota bacterium]
MSGRSGGRLLTEALKRGCRALLLLAVAGGPGIVLAQDNPAIVTLSQAEYQFGQAMRFSLMASGEAPIDQVTLFYRAPELPATQTAELAVEPGVEVMVDYTVDLTQLRLAPFTTVIYWWRIGDAAGNVVTTPEQRFEYADDQFDWQQLEGEQAVVYWAGGDVAVGQAALDAVAEAMPRWQAIMPVALERRLRIYVYPSVADLQAALRLTGQAWIGAHARPELGVILVAAGDSRTAAVELRQSVPHELSHLLLYQTTGVGYASTPRWFDEGLATLMEAVPNPDYQLVLQQAVAEGTTIPFMELCQGFPEDEERAILAYAQSASLVQMIQADYGTQALGEMIRAYADGADCQSGVSRALGVTLGELSQSWLERQLAPSPLQLLFQRGALWLVLIGAGFFLMLFFVFNPSEARDDGSKKR